MQNLPHQYRVKASGLMEGSVVIASSGLESLKTAPPFEFGGPGDQWSPETLLVAAVANCFVFTFRAIARASGVEWLDLECAADGTLDRVERTTRFVEISLQVKLNITEAVDVDKAKRLLEKAEQTCLITNSLACPVRLDAEVRRDVAA